MKLTTSLFAASSLILLAFARSHDGSGEGKGDTTKFPLTLTPYTLVFDSAGRKVLAERNEKTGKWKVHDMQKALDVLYKIARTPCPELIVEPEQENNFQLQLNESGRRSFVSTLAPIPDSLPVVKVKYVTMYRGIPVITQYEDSKGKRYFYNHFSSKVYDKHPSWDGATELKVRLDTSKTILDRLNGMQPFPSPLPDSLPKYRYVWKIEIGEPELFRIEYVLDSIIKQYGVEKGGTDIKKAESMFLTHFGYLLTLAKRDSVKIAPVVNKGGVK
jgi:hypothetical protein